MKKKIALLITASLMSAFLAGCGASETNTSQQEVLTTSENESQPTESTTDSQENITITYANFNASGGNEATLNSMYEAFHKKYPNITVEIETIAITDYFTTMQTRIAGGNAPDCYEMNIENFGAYASQGILASLDGVDVSAVNKTALTAFNYEGVQYGLPENFSTVILVYNKDLFDKAGIAYPDSTWTREDVDKAAEAIRALGDNIYGIYQPITYNEFYKVAAQYGGSLISADRAEFTINSKENIAALQSMVDRVQKTNVQPTSEQMGGMGDWDLFESGCLGMIPTGTWCFNTFTDACDFKWDICVEPGQTNKATHFFANSLVVNSAASEAAQEAAKTWITFLASSQDCADIRLSAGWDLPALNDMSALSSYLEITPPENRKAVFESLDSLVLPPIINDYSMMSDIISDCVTKASDGLCTASEALDEAQSRCEQEITLK